MGNDGLSMLLAAPSMAVESQGAYERTMTLIVELALTYLIHSTLFIATAWILLTLVRRIGKAGRGLSPANEERLWTFVTVLAFVTVPMSQCAGWNWPIWRLSNPLQTIGQESTDDIVASDVLQQHGHFSGRALETEAGTDVQGVDSSLLKSDNSRREGESTIRFSGEASNADLTEVATRAETPVNQTLQSATGLLRTDVESNSATEIEQSGNEPEISIQPSIGINGPVFWQRTAVVWLGSFIAAWMLTGTIRLVIKAVTLRRFLLACSPASKSLRKSLPRIALTTKSIRVLNSRSVNLLGKSGDGRSLVEPFACGIWSWSIVVPEPIEEQLPHDELRALLAHEVAHLIRCDPLWQWVCEFLCVCLPFQPLHFLVRRRWQQVAELMCDDWVVEQQISALALARCLTQIAELRLRQRPAFGMSAVDRTSGLTSRVEWLLRDRPVKVSKGRRGQILITVVTFLLGVCVGVYGPRITLTSVTLAGDQFVTDTEFSELESEMQAALSELDRIDTQLSQELDPEIQAISKRLRQRAESLRSHWKEFR